MADKPKRASEYESEQVELVRATCLYVATKLGDMIDDLLIIGGLVPSLIVDQVDLPEDDEAQKAVDVLDRDFTDSESVGPRRVAELIGGGPDDDIQADVVGFIGDLLRRLR